MELMIRIIAVLINSGIVDVQHFDYIKYEFNWDAVFPAPKNDISLHHLTIKLREPAIIAPKCDQRLAREQFGEIGTRIFIWHENVSLFIPRRILVELRISALRHRAVAYGTRFGVWQIHLNILCNFEQAVFATGESLSCGSKHRSLPLRVTFFQRSSLHPLPLIQLLVHLFLHALVFRSQFGDFLCLHKRTFQLHAEVRKFLFEFSNGVFEFL